MIYLYCRECRSTSPIKSKTCQKCGHSFPREGRKYRVSVAVKGTRINRIVDNLTLAREAEKAIGSDLLRDEYDITAHQVKKVVTLADVWVQYLPWAKEHKTTWKDDEYHYHKHLEPRFGLKPLEEITPFDVERMKLELKNGLNAHGKPYQPATIKHQLVLLRRLFNVAIKWGLFSGQNPMVRVAMPKLDNQVTEYMTEEQTKSLLSTLETWPCRESAAFVKFAMLTGLRRGELFKLKWTDVDLDRGFVTLRKPKGGKTETLPISQHALDVLKSLPLQGEYVFPGKGGKQRTDFKGPWERIRKAAGLHEGFPLPNGLRLHGLRHNFASHLVSDGIDIAVVGELLTHKDAKTTQRYAHLLPAAIQKAARKSAEILTGNISKTKQDRDKTA